MNHVVYSLSEQLHPPIEFLPANRYHLFVDGRWTDSFRTPDELMQSFRTFNQAHACTVVTGGEVDFYCSARARQRSKMKFTMFPCAEVATHGENCWSVYRAGTDYCEYAHITYAQAYYYCHGTWPPEPAADEVE